MPNNEFDLTQPGKEVKNPTPPKKDTQPPIPQPTNNGLTEEEERDPNKIEVVIADPSPIVVMFGARTSGKTMTLISLTRYLRNKKYIVEPDKTFRPSKSKQYQQICEDFDKTIYNNTISAEGTAVISFMLVKVMNEHGEPICQILEAPGEHYFDDEHPTTPFPTYINEILANPNPKTWLFIVERNWNSRSVRDSYAQKIIAMQSLIEDNDKIIFACHKADLHRNLLPGGRPNTKQFFEDIRNQYPGIFDKYKNNIPVLNFFHPYNFDFVVYSAGTFNKTQDGGQTYNYDKKEKYQANLWRSILKTVKGNWF